VGSFCFFSPLPRVLCGRIITPLVLYFLSERCHFPDDRSIDRQSYAIDWTDDVEEDDDVERGDDVDDETMINFFAVGLRAKRRTDTQKCYEKKG